MAMREKISIIVWSSIAVAYIALLIYTIHLPISLVFALFVFIVVPLALIEIYREKMDSKYGLVRYEPNPCLKQINGYAG